MKTFARLLPISGTRFWIPTSKLPRLRARGLGSDKALAALARIATALNAASVPQREHVPVRVQVSLDGTSVIITRDRWTGRPLILTAWTEDAFGDVAALRAARNAEGHRDPDDVLPQVPA